MSNPIQFQQTGWASRTIPSQGAQQPLQEKNSAYVNTFSARPFHQFINFAKRNGTHAYLQSKGVHELLGAMRDMEEGQMEDILKVGFTKLVQAIKDVAPGKDELSDPVVSDLISKIDQVVAQL